VVVLTAGIGLGRRCGDDTTHPDAHHDSDGHQSRSNAFESHQPPTPVPVFGCSTAHASTLPLDIDWPKCRRCPVSQKTRRKIFVTRSRKGYKFVSIVVAELRNSP